MTQRRWEADDIRVIGKLAKAGCSSAQIAGEFGVSRNTIIGVCYRNGIALGGADPCPKRRSRCANAINVRRAAEKRKEARQRLTAPIPLKQPEPPPAPVLSAPEGIRLEDLTNTTCRWPLLDKPPQRFCGAHTDCGSYCADHARRGISLGQGGGGHELH